MLPPGDNLFLYVKKQYFWLFTFSILRMVGRDRFITARSPLFFPALLQWLDVWWGMNNVLNCFRLRLCIETENINCEKHRKNEIRTFISCNLLADQTQWSLHEHSGLLRHSWLLGENNGQHAGKLGHLLQLLRSMLPGVRLQELQLRHHQQRMHPLQQSRRLRGILPRQR